MVLPTYYTLLAFLTSWVALAISKLCSEYQSRNQSSALTVIVSNTLFLFLLTLLLVASLFWLAYRTFGQPVVGRSAAGWVCVGAAAAVVFYRVGDLQ